MNSAYSSKIGGEVNGDGNDNYTTVDKDGENITMCGLILHRYLHKVHR